MWCGEMSLRLTVISNHLIKTIGNYNAAAAASTRVCVNHFKRFSSFFVVLVFLVTAHNVCVFFGCTQKLIYLRWRLSIKRFY